VRPIGRLVLDRMVENFFAETEQVAFCTNNVVPGIDFTNDPLLQGRNFSYLDTQLKRLGSPNFTYLPVNAPRCPVMHFQRDGHMTVDLPTGRANYEPNSWGDEGGPREDPERGFTSFESTETGGKRRVRPASFADHFSQARQFLLSQTPIEQKHISDALVFELSKVERPDIRTRLVARLRNVDEDLATAVADQLGMDLPEASTPARPPITDLPVSAALSIVANPTPPVFTGRKVGILVTDGTDDALLAALQSAIEGVGATFELIAPKIGGITTAGGAKLPAQQKVGGGPSVLYDAVAVIPSAAGAQQLAVDARAKDFVTDAFAHCKFLALAATADPLLEAAGIAGLLDEGCIAVSDEASAAAFVTACQQHRYWPRESAAFPPSA
jgi:catalase